MVPHGAPIARHSGGVLTLTWPVSSVVLPLGAASAIPQPATHAAVKYWPVRP